MHLHLRMHTENRTIDAYDLRSFLAVRTSLLPVAAGIQNRRFTIPTIRSLQVAQKWMTTCLNKHEQCQKHIQPHTYPTRLLKLEGHKVRLIFPRQDKPSDPYAALSYCWGTNPSFVCLTASNLQEFQLGVSYSRLPIAFREAIRLTEGLGIRYLWIDALCIIQSGLGSSEDWQLECGRMQDVYSNCVVNLTLAQAAHPNQSCLGGYTFDSTLPFEADIVFTPQGHNSEETRTYTILSDEYFKEALYKQPIAYRAWVLQERLLATRVLSIGHGEFFWDCQQVPHASESLPHGFTLCSDFLREFLRRMIGLSIQSVPETSDSGDLEEVWSKILMEYTARELTYPQVDKLVALSAIATRMGHAMNDAYLVGHFRKSLPHSLNWRVHRKALPALRAKERVPQRLPKSSSQTLGGSWIITPSWSWASMDGQLHMWKTHGRDITFVATTEAYELFPVSQKRPEAHVENALLLTIRTWCQIFEWKTVQPGENNGLMITPDADQNTFFVMDDMHDLPNDRSECLLAVLGYQIGLVEGLLLREADFNGTKVYKRFGHFQRFFANSDGPSKIGRRISLMESVVSLFIEMTL